MKPINDSIKRINDIESYIRGTDVFTKEFFRKRHIPDPLPPDGNPNKMTEKELTVHKLPFSFTTHIKIGEGKIKKIQKEIAIRYSSIFLKPQLVTNMVINGFDRRVHDAICNLYLAGYDCLTYHQIYKYLYHNKSMNQKDINDISESVMKIAWTWIKADFTEEIEAYGYETQSSIIDTYLIPLERIQIKTMDEKDKQILPHYGFKVQSVIHVLAMPTLLRLWKDRNQIQTIPRDLTKECSIPQNRWNIEIWEHLLDILAIGVRYHKVKLNYTNFAKAIQFPAKKVPELPNRIKKILKWFKTKKYVKNYEEISDKNGKAKGIEVTMKYKESQTQ